VAAIAPEIRLRPWFSLPRPQLAPYPLPPLTQGSRSVCLLMGATLPELRLRPSFGCRAADALHRPEDRAVSALHRPELRLLRNVPKRTCHSVTS
jgi:hypothetical protein